ncbi:hypothetical protein C922_00842 [Plasmodium inui San Antonio 1]|uniref:6-Cys domain-containing protein n=1 Tax=Plasmodium inui San Antonio 1 TaxID=1237626 RepID=W7ASK0_9APIC|nr:hypothetical protein C922_00842 [Plasmodium inui San Antonio 1]EUD68446.1 hypothetical protein C922_00842 [Plasmodium inui San Antonio 1]
MRFVRNASLWGPLLIWWFSTPALGFTHTCDFNHEISLEFGKGQTANKEKICSLKPDVLDKVVIKCGSETQNYELLPDNCFENVYTSKSINANGQQLVKYVHGAAAIMKRKQKKYNSTERKNYDDVSFRVPPNLGNEEKVVYCFCQNKAKIRVRNKKGGEEYDKEIFNIGIVEVIIPPLPKKIDGCDFTENTSPLFTKGYKSDANQTTENKDDVICRIRAREGKFIGFKCPSNFAIEPEECFIQGFNLTGKREQLQSKLPLTDLVLDHYNKVFYARAPETIRENMHFFCACVLEGKRLVADFEFIATPDHGNRTSDVDYNGQSPIRNGGTAAAIGHGLLLLLLLSGVLYFMG